MRPQLLVIDTPAAIACSALSSTSGSTLRVLLLVWCPFLLILKPERRRAYDPSPVGRLCGKSEDGLYCVAAYPFDHLGDSAINRTRVVPDSHDYLELIFDTEGVSSTRCDPGQRSSSRAPIVASR